jgi:hypothetical protein
LYDYDSGCGCGDGKRSKRACLAGRNKNCRGGGRATGSLPTARIEEDVLIEREDLGRKMVYYFSKCKNTEERLHAPDIPLHGVPLRLARGEQVPNVRNVSYMPVTLKLVPRVPAGLAAGLGVLDLVHAAHDGAVKSEDAAALEEVVETQRWAKPRGLPGCGIATGGP